jgi:ubiquinone/menaquinone biosynthesis C-methylase UbiE
LSPQTQHPMNTASVRPVNIQFSDEIPRNYDEHLGPLFFEPYGELLAARVAALAPRAVLELACGTGRLTRHIAGRLDKAARIVATDVNPAMLGYAKQQLPDEGIEWNLADAMSLPFPDKSFDLVVAQFGVMFFSDRTQAYREALRVLRPGGRLLLTTWNRLEANPAAKATQEVVKQYFPVDPPAFYTIPFAYHESMRIREDLLTAGFGRVQMELLEPEGHEHSAAGAAVGLLEGTPIRNAIMDRDPHMLPAMLKTLEVRLAKLFGLTDLHVPLSAWAVEARLM